MPPSNNEVLPIQAEILEDTFAHENVEDQEHHDTSEREWKKFLFIVTNGPFFRLFVNTLSEENEVRRVWDQVANGPLRALESLGVDLSQFQTADQMKEYIGQIDPDLATRMTEAFEELEHHYTHFRDELREFIDKTDPEAGVALDEAIKNGNIDEASRIIESHATMLS